MREELALSIHTTDLMGAEEFTKEEWASLQLSLWRFLGKRTQRYTTGDSSSVAVETAQELLSSICFTLNLCLKEKGLSPRLLISQEPDALFHEGVEILQSKIEEAKLLWQSACLSAPEIVNYSYQDTLRSIGSFWRYYDFRFLAHQIPCDIDYQLCHPVSEEEQGVEYIIAYLRRIILENQILRLFEPSLAIGLLERYCPDYKGLLINLSEPVITNAVALALLGKPPFTLKLSEQDQQNLFALLDSLPASQREGVLAKGAEQFCRSAGITDSFARSYVTQAATDLGPRISSALPTDSLAGIFIAFA